MMLQKGDYRVTEPRLQVTSADHTVQPTCPSKVMQSRVQACVQVKISKDGDYTVTVAACVRV